MAHSWVSAFRVGDVDRVSCSYLLLQPCLSYEEYFRNESADGRQLSVFQNKIVNFMNSRGKHMVQLVNLPLQTAALCIRLQVWVLTVLLPIQLPNVSRKVTEDVTTWATGIPVGNHDGVPGSHLWSGPDLVITVTLLLQGSKLTEGTSVILPFNKHTHLKKQITQFWKSY